MDAVSGPGCRYPLQGEQGWHWLPLGQVDTSSDLGTCQEGVGQMPPTSQGQGNGQGKELVWFSLQLNLNHLFNSKVRKDGSPPPKARQGGRQLSPGPAAFYSLHAGLPAPSGGPLPLCGGRYSKDG